MFAIGFLQHMALRFCLLHVYRLRLALLLQKFLKLGFGRTFRFELLLAYFDGFKSVQKIWIVLYIGVFYFFVQLVLWVISTMIFFAFSSQLSSNQLIKNIIVFLS